MNLPLIVDLILQLLDRECRFLAYLRASYCYDCYCSHNTHVCDLAMNQSLELRQMGELGDVHAPLVT